MNYCVGIDLGSTTTKAVILGEHGEILGRGITNSRSNYEVACAVALGEATINARFALIATGLEAAGIRGAASQRRLGCLEARFREQQYLAQLETLERVIHGLLDRASGGLHVMGSVDGMPEIVQGILRQMRA
jgi:benzoyl-CoA reductase subunit A